MPTISVVIPTYNRGAAVRDTIDSALAQTFAPLEILVIDDGSRDNTPDWIEAHYGSEGKVRVIRQENAGVARARNRGLKEARGEWIAYLDHDDLWLPTKLQRQCDVAQNQPKVAVVYCDWREIYCDGRVVEPEKQLVRKDCWKPRRGYIYDWLLPRNPIISMSVPLIRKRALHQIGGFDPRTVPCDDWDLWLRLSRRWKFSFVPEELVVYFRHDAQQSSDRAFGNRGIFYTLIKQVPYLVSKPRKLSSMIFRLVQRAPEIIAASK